jgi:hypothetical protein
MRRLALLLLVLPLIADAATLTLNGKTLACSDLRMGKAGNVLATCEPQEPNPPAQPPFPGPRTCINPAGETILTPNVVMQTIYMGGTNNYAVDDFNFVNPPPGTDANTILSRVTAPAPAGSIQVFTVPTTWPNGSAAPSVSASFVDWLLNGVGVQYEMALSTCKGDFSYYKTAIAANTDFGISLQPCGLVAAPFGTISWTPQGSFFACRTNVVPNATWYLNWRVVPGTAGGCGIIGPGGSYHTCGQTFNTSAF